MPSLSSAGKTALDNAIKDAVARGRVPCVVLGITGVDDDIYLQSAGKNIVGDPNSGDVNADSVFWICSQTKMIVSLAALKLIDQGKITFETAVADYLPEFRNPIVLDDSTNLKSTYVPAKTKVTVKHLMTHTSGLFNRGSSARLSVSEAYASKETHTSQNPVTSYFKILTGDFPALPLKFEPGTDFAYGYSSDALGFVVEKVSGQTLEEFCQENIFKSLGMNSTSFYLTDDLRSRLINLAHRKENGDLEPWADQCELPERDPIKVRLFLGGIGLFSSTRDYLKLLRHILQINAGREVSNPLLSIDTLKTIFTPLLNEEAAKTLSQFTMTKGVQFSTALAVTTTDMHNLRKKGSGGWGGWASSYHFIDPTAEIAYAFTTQIAPPGDKDAMMLTLGLEKLVYTNLES
ncbi:beta-lactamase/transpeptidase-like protein [Crepidotus variabilis]|uniref:Beta-lactamase/transpeptidase-like protein n=1 Tax=Crepidotus variabilis TaxID=179855 RepID=A0A9P6E9K0_9AGAR|nr:beta-lactamase/transpeptidase-like protein [Crepidotus variabilis]